MSTETEAAVVADVATRAAAPKLLNDDLAVLTVPNEARVERIELDKYREHPRRKSGAFAVHDADSFVAYLSKHGLPHSEVWADATGAKVVGVVNAHQGTKVGNGVEDHAGWGDHRVTFAATETDAWKAWAGRDGQLLSQSDFAELIEERSVDIIRPTAADMLELAQTFEATIGVRFESSKLLSSGERVLEYREQVDAKAGRAGKLEIPKDFELALIPFEGAERFKVTARFRYRITDGVLRVGYRLDRPADVKREAFLSVVQSIGERIVQPVLRGVSG